MSRLDVLAYRLLAGKLTAREDAELRLIREQEARRSEGAPAVPPLGKKVGS